MYSDLPDERVSDNRWYSERTKVLKEVIDEVNKDIPNQPHDHLPHLTQHNEKAFMKKLYEIRKRRFDELVEFDERIIEEDRKWQFYNKNPDQW